MGRATHSKRVGGLQFALTGALQDEVMETLFGPDPRLPVGERGLLGVLNSGHGERRRALYLRAVVPQESGWVRWTNDGLQFSASYFSRALTSASRAGPGAGLLIVHSHPGGVGTNVSPRASGADLFHERRLLCQAARSLLEGVPVASGIVSGGGSWRVREYWWPRARTSEEVRKKAFRPEGGAFQDVEAVRRVGKRVWLSSAGDVSAWNGSASLDSTLKLWGRGGQRILGNLRVGVAGAGGVGGMLVEQLARLGVGRLVLVDYDDLKEENMNRAQGAKGADLGKPKVEYLRKLALRSATAEKFQIDAFRESVVEWAGLRPLLDCDVILGAADSPYARQVLDHVAYAYEIPVIDGGTVFLVDAAGKITGRSQVSEAGPERPCLECQGLYTREEVTMARESPRQQGPGRYVTATGPQSDGDETPRAPSVISHNGLVASLMVQRLLRIALGFPPDGRPWQQRFYVELGEIRWGPVTSCEAGCPKLSWTGLGDAHPTPVGVDPFLQAIRGTTSKPSLLGLLSRRKPILETET